TITDPADDGGQSGPLEVAVPADRLRADLSVAIQLHLRGQEVLGTGVDGVRHPGVHLETRLGWEGLDVPGVVPLKSDLGSYTETDGQPHIGRVRQVLRGPAVPHVHVDATFGIHRDHIRGLGAEGDLGSVPDTGVAVVGPFAEDLGARRPAGRVGVPAGRP